MRRRVLSMPLKMIQMNVTPVRLSITLHYLLVNFTFNSLKQVLWISCGSSGWVHVSSLTRLRFKCWNYRTPRFHFHPLLTTLVFCSRINHIAALSRSCFFHLRWLRAKKQSLTYDATRTLVHAFVSSRLDSCNSLLAGVSSQLLQRLQVVQNAATRVVTGARRSEHMTPVLHHLHWLPLRQRSRLRQQFWSTMSAWHGSTVPSVALQADVNSGSRRLRSVHSGRLTVPHTRTNYGNGSFTIQGPRVWNSPPAEHWTSRRRHSETDLRHSCSICNCYPVHLQLLRDLALYKHI